MHGGPPPRPTPPPADATQFTNAFSGSLPPPPPPRPRPRPLDPATEVIPRVEDYDDEYDDYDDEYYEDEEPEAPAPPPDGPLRKTVRGIGELFITAGLVVLLFVVYEVYVTDLISAGKQQDVTRALDSEWGANTVETPPTADPKRQEKLTLIEGKAFAKMYIPVFGEDWGFSVVEGTTDKHLEVGPGHYVGTALPGENGNFAVAGHRVGKGAPFNDLDLLGSCDAIVVETQTQWFVYRVLPMPNEAAGWAEGKGTASKCEGIAPLSTTAGEAYRRTAGQEIVPPTRGEVISPVPYFQGQLPVDQQAKLLTLTTCHPKFSDKQRLIVHAAMTKAYDKKPGFVAPPEMKEQ